MAKAPEEKISDETSKLLKDAGQVIEQMRADIHTRDGIIDRLRAELRDVKIAAGTLEDLHKKFHRQTMEMVANKTILKGSSPPTMVLK